MSADLSRRGWLASIPALGLAATSATARPIQKPGESPFLFGLNTSTISGQKLPIDQVVAIAGKAGYNVLEPWVRELKAHKGAGKSLDDLRKQIADLGISVESAIGFAEWAVDDDAKRKKGLEQMRHDMEVVRAIGGKRIAAPPVGMTDRTGVDLRVLGERYRAICALGDEIGVVPEAEVWGPSKTMGRLGDVAAILIESGHPKACLLPDVYHLYKGGSNYNGIRVLAPSTIHVLHMNDVPADPPRATITDAHRVYPGAGIAPINKLLRDLRTGGFKVTLSLELFNRDYWKRDALDVAMTGLAAMKSAVSISLHDLG